MNSPAPSPTPGRLKQETLIINLILLALIAIFFAPALRPGRVLAAADLAFTNPYFETLRPPGWTRPHNPMLFDHAYLLGPWRHVTWQAMRAGRVPLWNPHSYCGSPLAGSAQAMVFSPINWLTALLPFSWGFLFLAAVRLWIAGWGTYLLARHYGLAWSASLVAAIAFMFCGFQVVWLMYPIGGVAAWLPLMVLAADKALLAPSFWRAAGPTACLAIITALHWTGGHPETSVDLSVTLALYAAARAFFMQGSLTNRTAKMMRLVPGTVLGLLLAAPAIMAFLEWLPLSSEFASRSQDFPFRWIARSIPRRLLTLPLLIVPDFYGNPTWPREWTGRWLPGFYPETALYIGTLPLILAFGAMLKSFRRLPAWAWVWLLVGGLSFARAFQLPLFDWLNQLPVLQWAHFTRVRFVFSFALCLFAGFGADLLIQELQAETGRFTTFLQKIAAVVLIAGAMLAFACPVKEWPIFLPPLFAAAAGSSFHLLKKNTIRLSRVPALLLILSACDLIGIGSRYNTIMDKRHYYPHNPVIDTINNDPSLFRATALDRSLIPDQQLPLGFSDIRGMDFQTAWFARYMALSGRTVDWLNHAIILRDVDSPLLRVLNLKYVIKPAAAGGVELETLSRVQPRGFMVYEAFYAATDDEAAAKLAADPDFVYRGVVLTTDVPERSLFPAGGQVECLSYRPNGSTWRVRTHGDGYFVMTDAYYPGWTAISGRNYLETQTLEIERANIAFRAVFLPAGEYKLEFNYSPPWLFRSLIFVGVAAVIIWILLFCSVEMRPKL